jgi:large subunit ribosomal protein L18
MRKELLKNKRHARRVKRVRKKIDGTPERPRLAITRSCRNIYAQIIDDMAGRTLCAAGTQGKENRSDYGGNVKAAAAIGKSLGEKARELGIESICFDRRGHKYHGRVKALAEAAREAGLKF